jgi:hypothetical protein
MINYSFRPETPIAVVGNVNASSIQNKNTTR